MVTRGQTCHILTYAEKGPSINYIMPKCDHPPLCNATVTYNTPICN